MDNSVFVSFPSDLADPINLNEISHWSCAQWLLADAATAAALINKRSLVKRESLDLEVLKMIIRTYGI